MLQRIRSPPLLRLRRLRRNARILLNPIAAQISGDESASCLLLIL